SVYERPSGIRIRWNATASLASPNAWTGLVSPRTRAPAGMTIRSPLHEYTGLVTRQFTGAAAPPSRRFVRTVSITVPSGIRWSGPLESIRLVGVWRVAGSCGVALDPPVGIGVATIGC